MIITVAPPPHTHALDLQLDGVRGNTDGVSGGTLLTGNAFFPPVAQDHIG